MTAETQDLATPRPWVLVEEEERGEFGTLLARYVAGIQDAEGRWVARMDDDYGYNNVPSLKAAIRAVNSHDALVAACEAALDAVIDEQDDFGEATTATLVVKLQHALRLARGGAE